MADFFCTESTENNSDAYTLQELEIALQRWQVMCDEAKLLEALPLSVVGDYWLSQLDEKGLTQRFFGGAVTFATLMPMRAIPFRHVCLLGMNDGDYPRTRIPMDFDLMGLDYRPGDRSRREDDRYLFLEALLSARDCLHISWIGRSINDNTPRPPSVLVGQLLDHLASGWRLDNTAENTENPPHKQSDYSGKALLAAMTVEHRLQPFSLDYFSMPPLFTYAHEWRQQAPCVSDKGEPENLPLLQREEPLTLRELGSFLKSPVRAFFQQRLNVFFEQDNPASEDLEPFVLDGLSKWHLQEELIHAQQAALLRGASVEEARETRLAGIQRRGDLAVGGFGHAMAAELVLPMQNLFERYSAALARWPQRLEDEEAVSFRVTLSGQRLEIADWVGDIRLDEDGQRGRVILETSDVVKDGHYRGEKVIHHWVTHLALNVAGCPLSTRIVSKVGEIEFKPLDCHQSEFHLTTLLAAWQQGMCRPLPLAVKTAFAWLGSTKEEALRVIYEGGVQQHGELDNDVYLQRAYPDFDALLAQSDLANSEFAALAKTLLAPLQAAMPAKS
jgi:exodeoxyribonuclease V gamma subunit